MMMVMIVKKMKIVKNDEGDDCERIMMKVMIVKNYDIEGND